MYSYLCATMSAVLTYWNGRGQAELVRMMLVVSGEEWTECVFGDKAEKNITTKEQMYRIQEAGVLAFDQLPLLQIDGLNLVQSMAITRYLARKHNLYGADAAEMVQCDIISECYLDWKAMLKFNDYGEHYGVTLKKFMPRFQRFIDSNPTHSGYFVGNSLTFVDVLVFKVMHDSMERENKPVVAEDGSITTIYSAWPRLQAHYYLMLSNPRLSAYISSEKFYPFPGVDGYFDRVRATIPWVFGVGEAPTMTSPVWNFKST